MDIRTSLVKMINAHHDGWDGMVRELGMRSPMALENRIYERKGQGLLVSDAMQMQASSGTTFFAEAVASRSGGVFLRLPDVDQVCNDDLLSKFNQLHARLGLLSSTFEDVTQDGEIDRRDRAKLDEIRDEIHKTLSELLALAYKVYCRDGGAE